MRMRVVVALLASTALTVAAAQESQPIVSGIVRERMLMGTGIPAVQVSASPPGNPSTTNSDGTFILEFPQVRPGSPIHIKLEKSDDRDGEQYVVVNDVQLETFLPNDPKHTLTFVMCKQHERQEYARHFYKTGTLSAIRDNFERKLAGVTAEREQLEQKLKAAQGMAAGREQELIRQINERDEMISQLQRNRAQAEAQAESLSESLAAGTADEKSDRYRQAMRLFLDGNIDEALKILDDDAIGREADRANREIAGGQRDLKNAIDQWLLKAVFFASKLQFDQAEKTYLRAIDKAPSSFDALYGYAQLNLVLHQHDKAIDAFSRSARLADANGDKAEAATALNALGNTYSEKGNFESAATTLQRSLSTYESLLETDPTTFKPLLARALINLGIAERHLDHEYQVRAKEHLDRAQTIIASLPQPESPSNLYLSAALRLSLGNLYFSENNISNALNEYKSSMASYKQLAESDARSFRSEQAQALNNLGEAERRIGEAVPNVDLRKTFLSQAEEHLQAAGKIRQELAAEVPQVHQPDYAQTLTNLGLLYVTERKFDQARKKLEKAKSIRSGLAHKDPGSYQNDFANTLTLLGKLYRNQYGSAHDPQLLQQAIPDLEEAVRIRESLAKSNPRQFTILLGDSLDTIGTVYMEQKRWDDAQNAFDEALEYYENLDAQTRAYPAFHTLRNLGYLDLQRGRTPEARKAFARAQDYFAFFSPEEKIIHKREVLDVAATLAALKASSKSEPANP